MKKIKFLSGAMFALAAVAFATTFTSCEKEELSFNLKPQVASLTIDATVVVIEDGVTVETKSFTFSFIFFYICYYYFRNIKTIIKIINQSDNFFI